MHLGSAVINTGLVVKTISSKNEKYVVPHESFNNYVRDVLHDFFVKLHDIMIDDYNALLFGSGEVFMIWSSR